MVLRYIPNGVSKFIDPGSEAKRRDASLVSKQPSDMSDTHTPFASVAEFWDKDLEYFETLTTAESQLIVAEDHHDELFLIDE